MSFEQESAQHSVHLTGGYAPRFQAFSLAQASSVKVASSRPSRQPVTLTVGRNKGIKMIFLEVIAIVFIVHVIWAVYSNITLLKKLRAKKNYKGATLNLTEKVIPERIVEPSTWRLTLILDVGRALLAILIILIVFVRSKTDSVVFDAKNFFNFLLVGALCLFAVGISGQIFGALIARGIQNCFSKVRHMSLSEQGILFGGKMIAWDYFRGYLVSSNGPYIYLLSKYYPTAIGFSFAPTSNEDFDLIIGEIKKYLPNCDLSSSDPEVGIFMNVYFQAVFLGLTLLLIELTGGLLMSIAVGIMFNSLLMYLHTRLSLRIINRIIPTDKFSVAEIE
ncbi:MAG TPA: hypothetical protein VK249_25665 [Anaerolineales bacterium]|nr:hypothetical protein [Anaerolineales bacterium]